jgi:O-antigen ligase
MDPRLRTLLFGIASSALAVWVGLTLAKEEHFIAMLSAGVCVWAILSWTRGPLAEAWLLGFLFFGYVIGSRGFAQITPVPSLPFFFSEIGLGVVVTLVLLRGALRRTLPLQRDWLNGLLLLWLALGTGRIVWDVRVHGLTALRDFAMLYYLLYFFTVRALAGHAPSRSVIHGAMLATFTLLPVTGLLAGLFPDFFLSNLLVEGVPLIFYKGDLLATFLFTGFIILLPADRFDWQHSWWRWLAALASLVFGLTLLSRSSMLGLAVAVGWLAWAGRWRPARVLLTICLAGLLSVTVYSLLQKQDFTKTKAYAIYEAVVSIADYSGTRDYQSDQSSNKGDNNRFRLVWWKNVAEDTLTTSPVLGLGFGADLAHGFLLEYYPVGEPDFSARSPHNIFMTTLGRMGLLGVAVLLAIYLHQARVTARVAREARADPARQEAMTLQAAVWVVMVSACLGVVLEGPMGAIPFWIILGLAHQATSNPAE